MKPSLSIDEEKKSIGEDFQGHAHESESVPPITSETPQESGRTWDNQEPPERSTAKLAVRHSNTRRQEQIPLKRLGRRYTPARTEVIKKIC